jgi:hypothetical protein
VKEAVAVTALSVGGASRVVRKARRRGCTGSVDAVAVTTFTVEVARSAIRSALTAGVAVADAATAVTVGGAGPAIRGATGCGTASTTHLLSRRTLTPTRRAVVALSRNGAGGFGEVGSATRLRRTREARPLPFSALAYTLRLLWSIRTEEALTELGTATLTTLGGQCHPWEGGQRTPYEGSTHQPERLTA